MSREMSRKDFEKPNVDEKPWGSYSGSEYSSSAFSFSSSSPMQCSSGLDETSSLCSSNSSNNAEVKLPKPPPSLGRRKQRKRCDHTPEIFEFSDLILEPSPLNPDLHGLVFNEPTIENNHNTIVESETTNDRYEALRNIDANDNGSFSLPKSISDPYPLGSNPFSSAFLKTCKAQPGNSTPEYQTPDKYAAISEATKMYGGEDCENLRCDNSAMENANCGWSQQVLHGGESCQQDHA